MHVPPLDNESALLQRISEGDTIAFEQVYQHYYVQLHPVFLSYSGSVAETEEVLQETFIKVWLHRDKLTEVKHFRGWIFKVASRIYLKAIRQHVNEKRKLAGLAEVYTPGTPESPQETTHVQEIKRVVREAVKQLPDQRRRIYELSRHEGLRIDEIAQRLGISTRTVKNTLSIALQAIREHLEASGHGALIAIYLCLQLL